MLLAIPAAAQTPIPHLILAEQAAGEQPIAEANVRGYSAVATDGEHFAIVSAVDQLFAGFLDYVTIVDAEGNPLSPVSITYQSGGDVPDVASSGRSYLAVSGSLGGTSGLLLDRDGNILRPLYSVHDPTRVQVSSHDTAGERSVAWNGSEYVVLTQREFLQSTHSDADLVATRVAEDGAIVQNDIAIATGYVNAQLAARSGVSVIAWSNDSGVSVRAMTGAGALTAPNPISNLGHAVDIAAGDDGFLVVWIQSAPSSSGPLLARHLDPSGKPDSPAYEVGGFAATLPAVTAHKGNYAIAWANLAGDIATVRASAQGALDATPSVIGQGDFPALASNPRSTLITWNNVNRVLAKRVDSSGAGQPVHHEFIAQGLTSLGFLGSEAFLGWSDVGPHYRSISSPTATILEGSVTFLRGLDRPLILSRVGDQYYAQFAGEDRFPIPDPRPFWTGSGFLFVWAGKAPATDPFASVPIYAQRLAANGQPIDREPREITSAPYVRALYAGASQTTSLITYVPLSGVLRGIVLSGNEVIDVGQIAEPQALPEFVRITSDGTDFLVTWISNPASGNAYIAGRRISGNGKLLDDWHIYSPGEDVKSFGDTFWTGQNYLVVWLKSVTDREREVWALRIGREGALLDYPPQRIGAITGTPPFLWAYRQGVLALAYMRDARVYARLIVPSRQHSIPHR